MEIKIARTTYQIEVDQYQYILKKLQKSKKEEDKWVVLGYHTDIFYVLTKLLRMGLMDRKEGDEFIKGIKDTLNTLKKSVVSSIGVPTSRDQA